MDALSKDPMFVVASNFCLQTHGKMQPLSIMEVVTLMHTAWDNAVAQTRHDTYLEVAKSCAGVAKQLSTAHSAAIQQQGQSPNGKIIRNG